MNIMIAPLECFIWLLTMANVYSTARGIAQRNSTFIMLTFHAKLCYKMLDILNLFIYNNWKREVKFVTLVHRVVLALMGF